MQQCDQRWFFNPEMRGNFRLGERAGRDRQMHKGAPFRLTQTHRFESLIQFQSPGTGGTVQERSEYIDILIQGELVSMLTNSSSVNATALLDLEQQDRFFAVVGRSHDAMRMEWFPMITLQDLLFPFRPHQQITRVVRDFVNFVRVNEF